MKHHPETFDINTIGPHGSLIEYIIGFVLSLILTLAAFYLVSEHILSGLELTLTIVGLAVTQFVIQLIFFFHMGKEVSPHWNLYTFLFMLLVMFILVVGTFWIMYHLNYNMEEMMNIPALQGL